jgi:uncharacterized damage-inducible protein DinB
MTKSLLADAFAHHNWATLHVIHACVPLSSEQLTAKVPGTYGSILETLGHLVSSDRSYLSLHSGGALDDVKDQGLDLSSMRGVMESNAPVWQEVLAADLDPDQVIVRRRDDGSESHAPLAIRLAQVIHHGTDHRSQVCTALTNFGIEPPAIDVWDFAEQDGRMRQVAAPTAD